MTKPCEIKSRQYGFLCTNDAVASVTFFSDGSGAKDACAMHLAKALEEVAKAANLLGYETLQVRPMGAMSDRIRSAKLRSN